MSRDFYVIVERDEDVFFVGEVPQLNACYTQGRTMDELLSNMREVTELCLEEKHEALDRLPEFIGVQKITV